MAHGYHKRCNKLPFWLLLMLAPVKSSRTPPKIYYFLVDAAVAKYSFGCWSYDQSYYWIRICGWNVGINQLAKEAYIFWWVLELEAPRVLNCMSTSVGNCFPGAPFEKCLPGTLTGNRSYRCKNPKVLVIFSMKSSQRNTPQQ